MKQIIEEVLQAEERVASGLKEAREQAAEIRRAAEKDISDQTAAARDQAQHLVQAAVEEAKKQAETLKIQKLQHADAAKEDLLSRQGDRIAALVDEICGLVLTTDEMRTSRDRA